MEPDALDSVENKGQRGEIGFVRPAGLQPVGENFGTLFDPVSPGECSIVVLERRLARDISTSAWCQYRSESTGCQPCAHKVRVINEQSLFASTLKRYWP